MMKNAINRYENTWQGRQFWNQILEDQDWSFDFEEIRELIDQSESVSGKDIL